MKRIYIVYDLKANCFQDGYGLHYSDAEAIRAFADAVRNPKLAVAQHPEDYVLYYIGNYHQVIPVDENGKSVFLNPIEVVTPVSLGVGSSFVLLNKEQE